MNEVWYYEYMLKCYDEIDRCEEIRSGVVPACNMAEVVENLESYYGKDICEIQLLRPLIEGPVFEFEYANDESNHFNYSVTNK